MRYIVTNYGSGENYTPFYFDDRRKAYEWFYTLIILNMCALDMIGSTKRDELLNNLSYIPVSDMDEIDVLKNLKTVSHGYIVGEEEGENVIQIFEIP